MSKENKCENCEKEGLDIDISNYVVTFESWEAYNCCCEECARKKAKIDNNIDDESIISIE